MTDTLKVKVPKKIIYQMKLELERKRKKIAQITAQIKTLEQSISEMEAI